MSFARPTYRRARRRSRSVPSRVLARLLPGLLLALAVVLGARFEGDADGAVRMVSTSAEHVVRIFKPDDQKTAAIPRPSSGLRARAMPICGDGRRVDCVVDGDTFWLDGEKFRIENIDAPEVHGQCRGETNLAARATRRLSAMLSGTTIRLERNGYDRYGRTLVTVRTSGGEVGARMVREGLARAWAGRRLPWCDI